MTRRMIAVASFIGSLGLAWNAPTLLTSALASDAIVNADADAPPVDARAAREQGFNPYWPGLDSPRLTTPQWVGEPGVEAVVVLAIDDMRDTARHEAFLRPVLERLKKIDGRAPVSIMTNSVDPNDPRLQRWLSEGLSLECHTLTHPCPCLQKGDFAEAARTFHGCVDLMARVPGSTPVAFRMPCCDSLNTVSPRFFAEIFAKTSPEGRFLAIDSSVMVVLTPDDPVLPRDLVFDADGRERFRKYLPFPSFVNTIENYPYPYIVGGAVWEFPCVVPDDWEGHNLNQSASPKTLEDMKAALDCVVIKQGAFDLVFHPYGWIGPEQVVALIDHAVAKHGRKVKFLTFREALERLNKNLLGGKPLRARDGTPRGARLVDRDRDGRLDGAANADGAPLLAPNGPKPPGGARLGDDHGRDPGTRFVDLDEDGRLDVVFSNDDTYGIYLFDPKTSGWTRKVMAGKAGAPGALPKIARRGTNNGFFVHSRHLWWQNEDTARLPNLVDRRAFNDLLRDVEPRGKRPESALKSIRVDPGFAVEQVAAEPLTRDPIALDWGADGRLWVVEMGDYPMGLDGRGKPGGVVRFLEDRDGDGRYDKSTVFLDGLGFPTGAMPWRKGVLVACAPEIFYAEDRDGDGKADFKEVLFTGFGEGNQQHRLNGFVLGLDGWVYGANGHSGGTVRSIKTGRTTSIRGRDFRFRPDTGEFEAESGQTQFGRRRDDWGRWFGNDNPTWGWHFVLADRDLRRNPGFAAPDARQFLEPDTRVCPVSRTLPRFNEPGSANHVTSANSPTPYRDDLFGPAFATSLFVSEPVHNVVHRMVLKPDGASFRGERAPEGAGREFLASSDNWFRPTMLKTGPDGALWVADMDRAVIEHPEWIPDDWEKRLDLRAGSEQGRIYRVFPADRRPRPVPRLDRLDVAGLVAALESPSGWQRDTAQRLLLHRGGTEAFGPLRALVRSAQRPQTRVQATWALADLGGLDEATALIALNDSDDRVRESAVRAVRPLLARSPALGAAVVRLAEDPAVRVRFEVALALGDWNDPRAGEALARLAVRDGGDHWMRAAVLSSAVPHVPALLKGVFNDQGRSGPNGAGPGTAISPASREDMIGPLVRMVSLLSDADETRAAGAIARALGEPAEKGRRFAPWQYRALAGLIDASERSKSRAPVDPGPSGPFAAAWKAARALVDGGSARALEAERIAAAELLGRSRENGQGQGGGAGTIAPEDRDRLLNLLRPQEPLGLQLAALGSLERSNDPTLAERLVQSWKRASPRLRGAVLDALLGRGAWTSALLSSLEDGRVPAADIDPARRQHLLSLRDPMRRARARAVLERAGTSQPRQAVVEAYRSALRLKGDRARGAATFEKLCASCHRLNNLGAAVGPDLATLNDKSPESLLVAILDPNRAVEAQYAAFNVATVDGRTFTGLIASESANSIVLRRQDGKDEVLLRADIEEMAASGTSLMPEGLEKDLAPAGLADLIAYIAGARPPSPAR